MRRRKGRRKKEVEKKERKKEEGRRKIEESRGMIFLLPFPFFPDSKRDPMNDHLFTPLKEHQIMKEGSAKTALIITILPSRFHFPFSISQLPSLTYILTIFSSMAVG